MARRQYAARRPAGAPQRVKVGMKFRATLADGNPLWEVIRKSGRSAWICRCVNEPFEHEGRTFDSDYAGTERAYTSRDILGSVGMAAMFDGLHAKHESWWASRQVGETLHYHNGFGSYVRGIVVEHEGEKKMVPTALVGKWREFDLPQRRPDGSIYPGYHAQKIQEKDAWQPNESSMYEANPSKYVREGDPRKMKPIDLSVPDMNEAEEAKAKLEQARHAIYELTNDTRTDPREALQAVLKVAQEALA